MAIRSREKTVYGIVDFPKHKKGDKYGNFFWNHIIFAGTGINTKYASQ